MPGDLQLEKLECHKHQEHLLDYHDEWNFPENDKLERRHEDYQ